MKLYFFAFVPPNVNSQASGSPGMVIGSVYGHLQQINLQRACLFGPLNMRTLTATSCSRPLAAATSSKINHLQLFTTCSGHLQLSLQLAVATCSNALDFYGIVPWYLNFIYFNFWVKQEWTECVPRMKYFSSNLT